MLKNPVIAAFNLNSFLIISHTQIKISKYMLIWTINSCAKCY